MDPKSSFSRLLAGEDRVLQMCTTEEPSEHSGLWGCGAGGRKWANRTARRGGGRCSEAAAATEPGGRGAGDVLSHSFSSGL
jgi:hypothetical protein